MVLDASVILKWFLREKDTESALKLKEKILTENISVFLPDLVLFEVANALRFKPEYDEKAATEAVNSLLDLGFDIVKPDRDILNSTFKISFRHSVTVYDAVYLALAKRMKCEFITADEKLFLKVKDLPKTFLLSKMK
jgi:predicted nucleic acid-binding protein